MDQPKKQAIPIGDGVSKPIRASEAAPMEAQSQPSQQPTNTDEGNTKPVSIQEALSLLQTLCLDLRSLDCQTAIRARKNRLYIIIQTPARIGELGTADGHITADNKPVSF